MESYEQRVVIEHKFEFPKMLPMRVLSEEEASELDLSCFEDINENDLKELTSALTLIPGVRVANGVELKTPFRITAYIGFILDTRKITFERLQKILDDSARVDNLMSKRIKDMIDGKPMDMSIVDDLADAAKTVTGQEMSAKDRDELRKALEEADKRFNKFQKEIEKWGKLRGRDE